MKIANLNVIIFARVEFFLVRFPSRSFPRVFPASFSFTVDGNLNGKFFNIYHSGASSFVSRIHRQKIYFYCLLSLHTTFPSPPTISQLIILYDWKIFLLDTIDGTLETDSAMDDVSWCLWHSRANCRLNFKLGWRKKIDEMGGKQKWWQQIICKVLIDDDTGLGGNEENRFVFWLKAAISGISMECWKWTCWKC